MKKLVGYVLMLPFTAVVVFIVVYLLKELSRTSTTMLYTILGIIAGVLFIIGASLLSDHHAAS